MIIAFRLSSLQYGGAERVFISVADVLARIHNVEIHFVIDRLSQGETESVVLNHGFKLFGLGCSRTVKSIIPFKKYIEQHQPDLVISAYTDTNMAAIISATLAGNCKVIVTEHASLNEHWQHASWKRRMLLNTYVRFGYRLADYVLAVSEGIAKQIVQRGINPAKVGYIYNPVRFQEDLVDIGPSQSALQNRTATVLAVGRIAKQKDYLTLLRAFKKVAAKKDVRLVIVGGVYELTEKTLLDEYMANNGLSNTVEFIGYTENVKTYYQAADVFVLSSAWEGFGNVIVEALAFGIPVVSTDCNHGPAEILCNGKFGKLVPVGNADEMAKSIIDTLEMPVQDRESLRKRSLDFSEERIASEYWGIIKKVLNKE